MNKSEKRSFIIYMTVAVFTLLLSVTGISFASWQMIAEQEDVNEIVTGCFDVVFTGENNINRLDQDYPLSYEVGRQTDPFTFNIRNNCQPDVALNVDYIVRLDITSSSDMPLNRMVAYLTRGNNIPVVGPAVILTPASFEATTINESGYFETAYILSSGTLRSKEDATYNLRLWIHHLATIQEASGRVFSARITVVSTASAQTEDHNL